VFATKDKSPQPEFWIAAAQVTKPAKSVFYTKLEETLESFGFAAKVRALCAPAYKSVWSAETVGKFLWFGELS
jgi:hypothetical protein